MPQLDAMDDQSNNGDDHVLRPDQKGLSFGYANVPHKASSVYYTYEPSVQEIYVNIKQYDAIRKRKARRDHLDSLMEIQRSSYLHESRHRHAMKRLRAPSGRFLTKEEMAELKQNGVFPRE